MVFLFVKCNLTSTNICTHNQINVYSNIGFYISYFSFIFNLLYLLMLYLFLRQIIISISKYVQ